MSALPPRLSPLQIVRALRAQKQAGSPANPASRALCRQALAESLEKRQMLSVTSAHISGPITVAEGNAAIVYISATSTNDSPPVYAPTYWSLSWGDGSIQTFTAYGSASLTHTYSGDEGTSYTVNASVSDAITGSFSYAYASQNISIVDAPLSLFSSGVSATEGELFSGTVAHFTDADPSATAADYSATVAWGDTTLPATVASVGADGGGGFDVISSHTFAEEGAYYGVVSVHDDGGASLGFSFSSTVADAPLSATAVNLNATSGVSFTSTVATFTDADSGGSTGDYSATIDWGDSTSPTSGTIVSDGTGGWLVRGTHVYTDEGDYTPTVLMTDAGGAHATTQPAANVVNPTITADIANASIWQSQDQAVQLTVKDRDGNPLQGWLVLRSDSWQMDVGDNIATAAATDATGKTTVTIYGKLPTAAGVPDTISFYARNPTVVPPAHPRHADVDVTVKHVNWTVTNTGTVLDWVGNVRTTTATVTAKDDGGALITDPLKIGSAIPVDANGKTSTSPTSQTIITGTGTFTLTETGQPTAQYTVTWLIFSEDASLSQDISITVK